MRNPIVCFLLIACLMAAQAARADSVSPETKKELSSFYHQFHENPELGKEESKTAEFIRAKLGEFGYKNLQTVEAAPTTVIAVLDTEKAGSCVCFRSEMDARKCEEKTNLPFKSKVPGLMHNCGHDAHAAILLETARQLMLKKQALKGKFVFLFQPAEECAGGADDIVNDGILKRLGVQAIFAMHCAPKLPLGTFSLSPGPVLAGSNNISLKIFGMGGHAAQPQERDDIASVASLLTLELQKLPGRVVDPIQYPAVCAITTSSWSSSQANVAPESISLGGTIRAFYSMDEKLFRGKSFEQLAIQLVNGICSAYGVGFEMAIKTSAPVTVNNPSVCKEINAALTSAGFNLIGMERAMVAEDFSYYTASIPSAYFGLGIASGNLGSDNVHSSLFTIHEDSLESGVKLLLALADHYAKKK